MAKPIVLRVGAETESAARACAALGAAVASAMAGVSASAAAMHQATGSSMGGFIVNTAKVVSSLTALQYAAIGAFAAFAAATAAGTAELEKFAKVAKQAGDAGLDTTIFQAWSKAAETFRMSVAGAQSDLVALEKSTRDRFDPDRASGRSNKAGELIDSYFLGTNDFGLSSSPAAYAAATTFEEKMKAVAMAMRDLEASGNRLAAIDLGRQLGMNDLVEKVEQGRQSFRGWFDQVERLAATGVRDGSLVSPELIKRADELKERWEANARQLDQNLRPILDECARLSTAIGNAAAWSAEQFTELVGVVGRVVSALRNATVEASSLNGAARRLTALAPPTAPSDPNDGPAWAQYSRDMAAYRQQRATIGEGVRRQDEVVASQAAADSRRALGDDQPSRLDIAAPVPLRRPAGAPTGSAPSARQAAAETDEWAKAYDKLINNLEKANATLQAEFATVGKSNVERTRAVELAKAEAEARRTGGTLTDEQRAKVLALAEAQARLKNAIADATAAQTAFSDAMKYAGDRIVDMVFNGRSLQDVLKGLGAELLRASLTGQGMFAQLLGFAPSAGAPAGSMGGLMGLVQSGFSASGGMWTDSSWMADLAGLPSFTFATGGWTGAGDPSQLAGSVHRGEFVFDAAATSRIGVDTLENLRQARIAPDLSEAARAASAAPAFSSVYNIDARGADQAAVARIESALARHDAEFEARTISTVRDAQKTMNLK